MSRSATSLGVFALYLRPIGAPLVAAPNFLLGLVRLPPTGEVWIRVRGVSEGNAELPAHARTRGLPNVEFRNDDLDLSSPDGDQELIRGNLLPGTFDMSTLPHTGNWHWRIEEHSLGAT